MHHVQWKFILLLVDGGLSRNRLADEDSVRHLVNRREGEILRGLDHPLEGHPDRRFRSNGQFMGQQPVSKNLT